MKTISRYKGSLLGLAVGDAVGTTLEFKRPGTFEPIKDMVGGGPFNLNPGEWTDDTSMALCLAESLIKTKKFDPNDQMKRYVLWAHKGHLSSNGRCFDIGNTIADALEKFQRTKNPYCGSKNPRSAGNGSLMRLAPIPLFFGNDARLAIENAGVSSQTTHGSPNCIDACRFMAALLLGAIRGASKKTLLNEFAQPTSMLWNQKPLASDIANVASGSYKQKEPPEIKGTGYVVDSLEAALWAFNKSENFKEGLLMVVNLGNDADTTGAIYGQLAGAYYGEEGIPKSWRTKIAHQKTICNFAEQLFKLAGH